MTIKKIDEVKTSSLKPILPSELPKIRIDYKGLIKYAKEKGVKVVDLSDKEKERFVSHKE